MQKLPPNIDKSWTLFLDRDGVINKKLEADYVKTWSEFEFIEGVKEAINYFLKHFGKIIIVTNQQGIGKGLMTEQDLQTIHNKMLNQLKCCDAVIHAIMYCPHLASDNCICRKPNIGMALKAKELFPEIDFSKSVMIGDSLSDIEFGKNAGMHTILIENKSKLIDLC